MRVIHLHCSFMEKSDNSLEPVHKSSFVFCHFPPPNCGEITGDDKAMSFMAS